MSDRADYTTILHEFESLLEPARVQLHREVLRAAFRAAVEHAAMALACVAAAHCLMRLAFLVMAAPVPLSGKAYIAVLATAATAAVAATLIRAMRRKPSPRDAAERLDLACADHNRVATALCLAERGDTAPFARAAIRDGFVCLHMLKDRPPRRDMPGSDMRRTLRAGGLFAALTAVAFLFGDVTRAGAGTGAPASPAGAVAEARRPTPASPGPHSGENTPVPAQSQPALAAAKPSVQAQMAGVLPPGMRNEPAAGRVGGKTGAEAAPSGQSVSARGEPTDASAMARSATRSPTKGPPPKRSKESRVSGGQKQEQDEESSSIGQGTSGGGTMSAVRHTWSQREQSAEGDRDEDRSDEQTENERESNTQRGGVQPSLKDRNEAPSRELGISGEEGPPGAGRGGPTPPKKSRGTASLVLGVPIPDFVKGRVGPGLTKINQERVEPSPMPGEAAKRVDVSARATEESPLRRFDVPAAFTSIVRDYLVALHSADRKGTTEPARAGPSDNESSNAGEVPAMRKESN